MMPQHRHHKFESLETAHLTADVQEVLPYVGPEERVHADGRLIKNE